MADQTPAPFRVPSEAPTNTPGFLARFWPSKEQINTDTYMGLARQPDRLNPTISDTDAKNLIRCDLADTRSAQFARIKQQFFKQYLELQEDKGAPILLPVALNASGKLEVVVPADAKEDDSHVVYSRRKLETAQTEGRSQPNEVVLGLYVTKYAPTTGHTVDAAKEYQNAFLNRLMPQTKLESNVFYRDVANKWYNLTIQECDRNAAEKLQLLKDNGLPALTACMQAALKPHIEASGPVTLGEERFEVVDVTTINPATLGRQIEACAAKIPGINTRAAPTTTR